MREPCILVHMNLGGCFKSYDQDPSKKWGVGDKTATPAFKAGQWHQVLLQVSLNDPGRANGSAQVFIDGKKVLQTEQVTFRGEGGENTLIRNFLVLEGIQPPPETP